MAERIPQSVTLRIPLYAVLASDHISPATGKTIPITISKNGAPFGNPSGGATNATEIGNGWYYFDASTTDTGTVGPLVVHGAVATVDNIDLAHDVVTTIPTAAQIAHLDADISSRMATYTQPTGFLAATFPNGTIANTTNITAGTITTASTVTTVTGLTASNLDATVSSRLASASYTAPDSAATIAAAVLASTIETGMSLLQYFRLAGAVLLGKLSGADTTTNTFRNAVADSKARVTATVDDAGNRSAITYDAS